MMFIAKHVKMAASTEVSLDATITSVILEMENIFSLKKSKEQH